MIRRRLVVPCVVAFLLSQIFAIVIHGFLLSSDYEPFDGTLLRSADTDVAWQAVFLPIAHLSFVVAFVGIFDRISLSGTWIARGLKFGFAAWLMAQVPLWLLWYAEQPWPGILVIKQLGLEFVATLLIGMTIAWLSKPRDEA